MTGDIVSTHSRPKAAGVWQRPSQRRLSRFNTQPPEGGWTAFANAFLFPMMFQHTAARRRLDRSQSTSKQTIQFQHTAARRRLEVVIGGDAAKHAFQHTAARRRLVRPEVTGGTGSIVSTHSRPKAAGFPFGFKLPARLSFNTQPPEGGWEVEQVEQQAEAVQHTAARRRLVSFWPPIET